MKKLFIVVLSLVMSLGIASLVLADKGNSGTFTAKKGDTIQVCGCGESCKCGTLGKSEGTCGCGQKTVKATVTKIDKNAVYYKIAGKGKELSSPVTGKYKCGCGDGCNCGYVGQQPGKCGCGKDMVPVKKS